VERAELLETLRQQAVLLLDVEREQIREEVSFKSDLKVDSLALVEYTMAIEDELGISLPEDELIDVATIGAFLDVIVAKMGETASA